MLKKINDVEWPHIEVGFQTYPGTPGIVDVAIIKFKDGFNPRGREIYVSNGFQKYPWRDSARYTLRLDSELFCSIAKKLGEALIEASANPKLTGEKAIANPG